MTTTTRVIPQTADEVAARLASGEPFWAAVGNFLEYLKHGHIGPAERTAAIAFRPRPTGDRRTDAFLAAIVEDLACRYGVPVPSWTQDPDRFLPAGQELYTYRSPRGRLLVEKVTREPYRRHGILVTPDVIDVI